MTKKIDNIEHPGIVQKTENKKVWVKIEPQSACGNCHSKSYCGMAEAAEKVVEANASPHKTYQIGQNVTITLKKSLGYKALFLGYILPFLVLLSSLIIFTSLFQNDALSALLSLVLLVPYYLILFYFREKVRSSFRFFIKN